MDIQVANTTPSTATNAEQVQQSSSWGSDFSAQVKGMVTYNSWISTAVQGVSQYAKFPVTQLAVGLGVLGGAYWAVDKAVNESETLADAMLGSVQHSLRGIGTGVLAGVLWPVSGSAAVKFMMRD